MTEKVSTSKVEESNDENSNNNLSGKKLLELFQSKLDDNKNYPVAVAAIQSLTEVVKNSSATTFNELHEEILNSISILQNNINHHNLISLKAVSALFKRFVIRTFDSEGFTEMSLLKKAVTERGNFFAKHVMESRLLIAQYCLRFIRDGCTILTHSTSQVVQKALIYAAQNGRRFKVIVTETRPFCTGYEVAQTLKHHKIPVNVILDSSVASIMNNIDFILVGAEGVVESGGIINRIGTYQIGIIAKYMNRPFYVLTESCKFSRLYPLLQSDIPKDKSLIDTKRINIITESIINSSKNSSNRSSKSFIPSNNDNNNNNDISINNNLGIESKQSIELEDETINNKFNIPKINTKLNRNSKNNIQIINEKIINQIDTNTFEKDRVRDYTPPDLITLLFTDLGILTPSAVSDELIKLYN